MAENTQPVLKFEFTVDEANLILNALGQGSYVQVQSIIDKMKQQAAPQLSVAPDAPVPLAGE